MTMQLDSVIITVSVILSTCCINIISSATRSHTVTCDKNRKLINPIATIPDTSWITCSVECFSYDGCLTFSYNRLTRECMLGDNMYKHSRFYAAVKDWLYCYTARDVIVLTNGKKGVVFNALPSCKQIQAGARVASYDDVWQAFNGGMVQCIEGWVSQSTGSGKAYKSSPGGECDGVQGLINLTKNKFSPTTESWCIISTAEDTTADTPLDTWLLD